MSPLNISLIILALGLWASIFIVRFKDNIYDWVINRYGPEKPPEIPAGGIPEVPLPFRYSSPSQAAPATSEEPAGKDESRE